MKKLLVILSIITVFISCKNEVKEAEVKEETEIFEEVTYQDIKHDDYELSKPVKNIEATLVLFGGFPETAKDVKREFKILEKAKNNDVAVLFMNYNRKLWLGKSELEELTKDLKTIFNEHNLPEDNMFIGGFSSGGNMALLISDYMTNGNSNLVPEGVFIVDSPIDLVALYKTSEKNLKRNLSNSTMEESTWILETLSKEFGNPHKNLSNYEAFAVFTSETNNFDNIENLKNTRIRLYTEPDTLWWKERTMAKYDEMNAYYIKSLSESLKNFGFKDVQYIATKNKGYRSNGDRHPHSWSIVDKDNLIDWILKEEL
ncbi:hypothetical protein [uncultured Winogradskyella sp.]|uniref:hypothetical protein n=1 Tax=uncultured Winogradskyella sp. TaxID=395353 RepID=UPI00261DCB88|nr:hypothetical protein [uncultured Winogradskyella sp.]